MITAAAIRVLIGKGLSAEDIAEVAEAMEQTRPLSSGAERTRRWRERHGDVTVTSQIDLSPKNRTESLPTSENLQTPILQKDTLKGIQKGSVLFAEFWKAYPNKVGKRAAQTAYERALKRIGGPDPPSLILEALERAKATVKWQTEPNFIPHPTTWLNQDRWWDEPAQSGLSVWDDVLARFEAEDEQTH